MTLLNWVAVIVVILTIAALIKRYETRLVLFTAGLILCCVSLQPMTAFNAFAKSMTNGGLIMAICASMALPMCRPTPVATNTWCTCSPSRFVDWAFSWFRSAHS